MRLVRFVVCLMVLSMFGSALPAAAEPVAQESSLQPVAMVSGPWRMMAWQFAVTSNFPEHGLEARSGSSWGILIADITNTGAPSGLPLADVSLGEGGVSAAPSESVRVTRALGFGAIGDDGVLPIAENGIARMAAVFDIPNGVDSYPIRIGDQMVPVDSVTTPAIDVSALPEVTSTMQLEHVTPSRYYDPFGKIGVDVPDGSVRDIDIAGVTAPRFASCHADLAFDTARLLAKDGIWVETIPGVNSVSLWVSNPDAYSFKLMDEGLIEAGAARVAHGAAAASPYSTWLASVQEVAQENEVGGWGECRANAEAAQELESAIGADRGEFPPVDPLALYASPESYVGTKVMVTGVVDGISYENGMTIITLVNLDTGVLTVFGVGYQGVLPHVSSGQYVAVYGAVTQAITLPNRSGVMTRVPMIFATIVE